MRRRLRTMWNLPTIVTELLTMHKHTTERLERRIGDIEARLAEFRVEEPTP